MRKVSVHRMPPSLSGARETFHAHPQFSGGGGFEKRGPPHAADQKTNLLLGPSGAVVVPTWPPLAVPVVLDHVAPLRHLRLRRVLQ
eukprot:132133-Rhodomonas_salina.1